MRRVGRRAPPKVSPERFKVPGHWLAGQPVIPPAEVSVQLSEGARFPPSPVPETEDQRVVRLRGAAEGFTGLSSLSQCPSQGIETGQDRDLDEVSCPAGPGAPGRAREPGS